MRALAALVRFELVRRLRWRPLLLLVTAHPVLVAVTYGVQPESDPRLGADAAAIGIHLTWLFLISFELGRDRGLGMDALLTSNLAAPKTYVTAKLVALGGALAAYHAAVLLVVAGFDPAGIAAARGMAGQLPMVLPLLPLALAVELVVPTRAPMAYAALVGTGLLLVAYWSGLDADTIAAWLGLEGDSIAVGRPAAAGGAGLAVLLPLAARRAASARPF